MIKVETVFSDDDLVVRGYWVDIHTYSFDIGKVGSYGIFKVFLKSEGWTLEKVINYCLENP